MGIIMRELNLQDEQHNILLSYSRHGNLIARHAGRRRQDFGGGYYIG